jgi:acyl-coenzyme A thioesterase PaaI-like protein
MSFQNEDPEVVHMELHNDEGELIATGGGAYVVG